ncbi:MAG: FHA domain-containing protein [Deltaproteobacteria bacterium]|nr:FHA domain-containing protein [Deltaproteobacteria bacterium]
MAKIDLMVVSGVSAGDVFHFDLKEGQEINIGRLPASDIVLADPAVSRQHAAVTFRQGKFLLGDKGSQIGTLLMGFKLPAGMEHAKPLSNNGEFKIGETIFRAIFAETCEVSGENSAVNGNLAKKSAISLAFSKQKKLPMLLLVLLGMVLAYLLFDTSAKPVADNSDQVLTFPQLRALGNWSRGESKNDNDSSHPRSVKFAIPSADILIEYEFKSDVPLVVMIEDAKADSLEKSPDEWQKRQLIIRDVLSEKERQVVFKKAQEGSAKWAVRNIRKTSLVVAQGTNISQELDKAIAISEALDKNASSLFEALRIYQSVALQFLVEMEQDAIGYPINLAVYYNADQGFRESFVSIKRERANLGLKTNNEKHLQAVVDLIGRIDAELWRRVNNRINKAQLLAKTKDQVDAYYMLTAGKEMFSDESDYRVMLLDRLLTDTKIIPKKLAQNPEKFSKKQK